MITFGLRAFIPLSLEHDLHAKLHLTTGQIDSLAERLAEGRVGDHKVGIGPIQSVGYVKCCHT